MKAVEKQFVENGASLIEMFRKAYSSLNQGMSENLVNEVTGAFKDLVESFTQEQAEKAWSSLGRLLSNSQFLSQQ